VKNVTLCLKPIRTLEEALMRFQLNFI